MRPQVLYPLFAGVAAIRGVGPRLAPLVERAAGSLVRDLLFLPPNGVAEREFTTSTAARDGGLQTFSVRIDAHLPGGGGRPYRIRCADETGFVFLAWFKGGGEHLKRAHPVGEARVVSGEARRFGVELQIAHPDYVLPLERADEIAAVEPIYPTTVGLTSRTLRRFVQEAVGRAPDLTEWLDPAWKLRNGWPSWRAALEALHAPASVVDLTPEAPARARLAYDELLAHQLAMATRKARRKAPQGRIVGASPQAQEAMAALPFQLTGAQRRTLEEIRADLLSGSRMTRLVQGDVGSGKTVVALLAAIDVAAANGQTAIMAPTEILARQHFDTMAAPLARAGVDCVLLTGRDRGPAREAKLTALASGGVAVAVGTHALFQDDVAFAALTLAVIDEQHRFGVGERQRLQEKGQAVHLLTLSATPIPRTLELTLFGDLDVSRIDEKPPGRKPVATTAAPSTRLAEAVRRLKAAVDAGAQAFWICPLVAESETDTGAAAIARAEALRENVDANIGLVHGRMAPGAKDAAMAAFAAGETAILVATTVVEVGVDVPAATIMVIEHAERFGLAQLHQLRGRVGRGAAPSACLLLYDPPLSKAGQARLEILRETDDGFLIAERDLELRGGGDIVGRRQSGLPDYRFAVPETHHDLVRVAADDAGLILARDPTLTSPRGEALRCLLELFPWRLDDDAWSAAG